MVETVRMYMWARVLGLSGVDGNTSGGCQHARSLPLLFAHGIEDASAIASPRQLRSNPDARENVIVAAHPTWPDLQ